ncbi:AMP-binding protein [Schaalia sp. 19OD2882]|uniref:AMP-binding protein n=1 Tax=Schaalia sp. 19OD2882 TaxID=2794089 RepID=UPI001C1EDFB4|nr:AMP-binding protein [Schaalia sp. 19OD2882]QWW18975.1 AMP-binding protein [Schaalia sp. 19OD2882]
MSDSTFVPENTTVPQLWARQVEARGDHEFLVFEDAYSHEVSRFTYRQFDVLVNQCANALAACGVVEGTRVALHLDNRVEFVECLLALAKMGAVAVPVDATSVPVELARILDLSASDTLITCQDTFERVRACLPPDLRRVLVTGRRRSGQGVPGLGDEGGTTPVLPLWEIAARQSEVFDDPAPLDPQDLCAILFTSGTTSAPKGVMITHANVVFSGNFVNWELDMNPEDRYMTSMVAARVNFQLSALAPVLTIGATIIMLSHYRASCFWKQARAHRATLVQGMAMIVSTMLRQEVDPMERDHSVREMHYFLPLCTRDKEAFEERFGVTLLNNYGSTECLIGAVTDPPHGPRRWPAVGKAAPGYRIRVVDEAGHDLPDGEVGELLLHGVPGVSLMAGYWDDPEATAEVLDADGWYRTHDYAYVEDGWVHFVDRRVDLIKRSGESVSSAEVESVIAEIPGVCETAVIGIPDDVRGQAVKAFVVAVPDAGLDAVAVIDHCAHHLAAFKVPSIVEFVDDLPRGAYGKVQKNLLTPQ